MCYTLFNDILLYTLKCTRVSKKLYGDYGVHSGRRYWGAKMQEYSRILIEQYCLTHRATQKSSFLWNLLELSYSLEREPEDWEAVKLEQYISREKNPDLKAALGVLEPAENSHYELS